MEQPRCKTCKWWANQAWPEDGNMRECLHENVEGGIHGDDRLVAIYCDGEILTGPDFGCVHHEEKD